jgi:sialate O-acetylesterase
MEWPLNRCTNGVEAVSSSSDAQLRLFVVPRLASDTPMTDVKASWSPCNPNSATNFSGVCYFFGRDLRRDLKVPVGLIGSYYGGTPAQAWTDRQTLAGDPELNSILEAHAKAVAEFDPKKMVEENKKIKADYEAAVAKALAEGKPKPGGGWPKVPPKTDKDRPAGLYNGMIAPLQPFAVRGVIWYQGESNSRQPQLYQKLFPAMIGAWRSRWGEGVFPFLFVQLASYAYMPPEIREAQFNSWQSTTNTAMVVTTDVGNRESIHPTDKEPVGQRLALAARALAYGEKLEYSGPEFDKMSVRKDRAVISFKHTGGGLAAKGGALRGFTIAGPDKKYVPAAAKMNGDTIEVYSDQVPAPIAVRYGWSNLADGNLYNQAGLPASPFRTDK